MSCSSSGEIGATSRSSCSAGRCCRISVEIDAAAFDAFEVAGWEPRARQYDRFWSDITGRSIEPLLDAALVGRDQAVLDLATGPGHVAAAAGARGAEPIGLDVANSMIELARELHPNIEFVKASAAALPFGDESFDAVVGNFVVLHVGEPERVAREIARVLRRGGSAALSTWDVPERTLIFEVVLGAIAETGALPPDDLPPGPPFFRFADDGEFSRLLTDAGLDAAEVRTIRFRQPFPDGQTVWEGMTGATVRTAPLVTSQSKEVQHSIRAAFDSRISQFRTNGEVELPISVKIASARKPGP
jgi:SAM-dependent methyltransferase